MALKEKIEKNRQEKHDEKYMKMALSADRLCDCAR
mgnify:CR=1 FL=1